MLFFDLVPDINSIPSQKVRMIFFLLSYTLVDMCEIEISDIRAVGCIAIFVYDTVGCDLIDMKITIIGISS